MPSNPWGPDAYKGSRRKRRYFEGWYFKQVSADFSEPWSFIPGIAKGEEKGEGYAFVQAIDGRSGRTWWFEYPLEAFEASKRDMDIRVGREPIFREGRGPRSARRRRGAPRRAPLRRIPPPPLPPPLPRSHGSLRFPPLHGMQARPRLPGPPGRGRLRDRGPEHRHGRRPGLHREGLGLLDALELDLDAVQQLPLEGRFLHALDRAHSLAGRGLHGLPLRGSAWAADSFARPRTPAPGWRMSASRTAASAWRSRAKAPGSSCTPRDRGEGSYVRP